MLKGHVQAFHVDGEILIALQDSRLARLGATTLLTAPQNVIAFKAMVGSTLAGRDLQTAGFGIADTPQIYGDRTRLKALDVSGAKVDSFSLGQRVHQHGMAYVLPALRNHLSWAACGSDGAVQWMRQGSVQC